MSNSYEDRFRDATVKTGSQRKIELPCPKCKHSKLLEIEIKRTAGAIPYEKRFAGFDFCCPICYYKWKEMEEINHPGILVKRPGLYVKSIAHDIEYTKTIAAELMSFFKISFENHPSNRDNEKVDWEMLRQVAIAEYETIDEIFTTRMLIASEKGNIAEDMFDHIWINNWIRLTDLRSGQSIPYSWGVPRRRQDAVEWVINGYEGILGYWKTGKFGLY